ncbi:MAG TPA: hypothetical protein DCX65_02365 [Spirochaetaceae bacterium]|nr:hypothetical protein [Spirochaetaceae bacterium]
MEEAYAGAVPAGYEIGTDSVRLMAALHAGLPFTPEDGTLLPDAAVALLAARPGVDATAIGRYALSAVSGSAPLRPVVNAASAIVAPVPTIATSPAAAAVAPATATPVVSAPATAPAAQGPALGSQAGNGAALSATGRTLVGKTTFGELYAWGLTEAQVAAVIGYAPGPGSQSVRDSLAAVGLEFSAYKVALQALIDGLAP